MWKSVIAAVALGALVGAGNARAADYFDAYAAPNTWGPTYRLRAHLGRAGYTVSYKAVGKTAVVGEVTYYATKSGPPVTRQFNGSISFTTGDCAATPTVRFKGIPFGSAVKVTVLP
jgi:hypothetical protein